MHHVRSHLCQILGCGGLARTSSDVANPRAAEADRTAVVEEEPEGVSIPTVIRPGSTAPRARGRPSLLLTELLREARQGLTAKATDEIKQKLTLSESAQRARTAKARKNARLKEASPVVAKQAKQERLNMLTLGDSAIAMLVKGCAEPFAVLPIRSSLSFQRDRFHPRTTSHWSRNCAERIAKR